MGGVTKVVRHRLTRYESGAFNGAAWCDVFGEVWRVEWTTPSGRRTRARRVDPGRLFGRCEGCGRQISYEDLAAAGVVPDF